MHHKVRIGRHEVVIKVGRKTENADVSYTFGPFRLDTRAGELRRDDHRIPLPPKIFQLLLHMLENRGRLIPKRELLDAVWGDIHVEEGSVTRAVTRLRSALGDTASQPKYVETMPRRGYRFVAAVEKAPIEEIASPSRFQIVESGRRYPLMEGDNVLGRASDCEVSLELASISRHHALITVEDDRITLRDLRSKNGTFVRGRRVDETVEIRDGDQIRLGSVTLIFTSASADPSTLTEAAQGMSGQSKE